MHLVLHPGSSSIDIAAALSDRSDRVTEVVKDSRMRSLKFLAAFLAERKARFQQSSQPPLTPLRIANELGGELFQRIATEESPKTVNSVRS